MVKWHKRVMKFASLLSPYHQQKLLIWIYEQIGAVLDTHKNEWDKWDKVSPYIVDLVEVAYFLLTEGTLRVSPSMTMYNVLGLEWVECPHDENDIMMESMYRTVIIIDENLSTPPVEKFLVTAFRTM